MSLFGTNLKSLRKSWGESQLDLASVLETEVSTISQWESGKRTPNHIMLKSIASHYQVTIDNLLDGDLSEIPSMIDYFIKIKKDDDYSKWAKSLFPLFATEFEKSDINFKNALEIQKRFMNCDGFDDSELDLMLDIYFDLVENDSYPSVKANLLSFFFRLADANFVAPYIKELNEYLSDYSGNDVRKRAKFLISNYVLNRSELKSQSTEELMDPKDWEEIVLPIIEKLKKNSKFYQIADYYFVLRYLYGFVDNNFSSSMNQQICASLLLDLVNLNNEFAKNFCNF